MKVLGVKDYIFDDFPDNEFDKISLLTITKKIESEIKKVQSRYTSYTP